MNCNKTSNNKYFDCPALMSDGRIMTDYRQSCTVNDMIRLNNNVLSSNDYRQFLINNAEDIININQDYIAKYIFGFGLLMITASLLFALLETLISTKALEIHLKNSNSQI